MIDVVTRRRGVGVGPGGTSDFERGTKSFSDLPLIVGVPVAAAVVLMGAGPSVLQAAAGLFMLIVLPVQLLAAKINWPEGVKLYESLLYSLALVVLGLMLGGLALNTLLPLLGIARPLDRTPVVATLLMALLALGLWRPRRWRWRDGLSGDSRAATAGTVGWRDQFILILGVIVVVGAVAGAVRLNNGLDGSLTTATLIFVASAMVVLFSWRRLLNELTIGIVIFLLSLSLLFMTSMRGWNVTGHDIQREYGILQLAMDNGVWDIDALRDAYNACLSITVLPAIVVRTTGIPDLYVFKVVSQALFALCAVLVYLIARRFASRTVALLGVIYFLPFPVYFSDMPYLNRQQVAFFLVGVILLLVTNGALTMKTRRVGFVILGIGVLLSHYSTIYMLLLILTLTWSIALAVRLYRARIRRRTRERSRHRQVTAESPTVLNWAVLLALATCTFLWVGPITHTASELDDTISSTLKSLTGDGNGARSSTTSFSILGGAKLTPEQALKDYSDEVIERTQSTRDSGETYPLSEVEKYPINYVPFDKVPLGVAGRAAQNMNVNVADVKHEVAWVLARLTQVFIAIGLILVLRNKARGFRPTPEFVFGAAACIIAVALNTLLPIVSTKYDVGRTFLQSLFWLAPVWAVGSIQAFGWLGRARSIRVALGIAIVFFLLASNVISQIFGGEPPAMQVNNSGPAYDKYYVQVQDVAAIEWLDKRFSETLTPLMQAETFSGIYAYSKIGPGVDDISPAEIRKDAYVFLNDSTTQSGAVTVFSDGDNVSYRYPFEFLDSNKSLIFSSGGARIYR